MELEVAEPQTRFVARNMAFYIPSVNGCELYSNKRDLKLYVTKISCFDTETNMEYCGYTVICFVKDGGGWVKGNNNHVVYKVSDYIDSLRASFEFTKAISEYDEVHIMA